MGYLCSYIVLIQATFLFCGLYASINEDKKARYLNCFIDYLNSLPGQKKIYSGGVLLTVLEIEKNVYFLEVNTNVREVSNPKKFQLVQCKGKISDNGDFNVTLIKDTENCEEDEDQHLSGTEKTEEDNGPKTVPVSLDNEGQQGIRVGNENFNTNNSETNINSTNHVTSTNTNNKSAQDILKDKLHLELPDKNQLTDEQLSKFTAFHNSAGINTASVTEESSTTKVYTLSEDKIKAFKINENLHDKDKSIAKRQIISREREHDPNSEVFRELAEKSLRQYESDFNSTYVFAVIKVIKVIEALEGSMTRIDFKASPILCALKEDCSKVNMHAVYKCHSEIWSRPWMVDGKQIVVNCYDESSGPIVGGWKEENPNDSRFRDLAEESLRKYEIHSTNKYALTLVKVDKVMTQVVSGSLTRIDFKASTKHCLLGKECPELNKQEILQCHSEIWDQPWLKDGKRINVNCVSNRKYIVPGAPEEQEPNKNEYRQLAVESLRQYEIDFNSSYVFTLVEMDKVTTQVVAGLLTRIDFKASPALCALKGDCSKVNMHAVYKCHSEIWSRPWMVDGKQIVVNCNDGPIMGGLKEEDPNDSTFRDLAEESLRKYEIHSTNKYVLTLVKVDKVMTQVVSGSLTRIDFKASKKHCLLGKECPELNKQEILQCHSEIWDQPWLKDGKRINVNCVSNHKSVNSGAPEEQDPNKNEYRQLAVESLRQYEIDFNSSYVFTLVEMDKVTTQVVAGLLTRIDFKASPALCALKGDCSKVNMHAVYKCHSEIWSRPWMVDGKQIVVNCYDGPITGGLKEEDPNDSTFRDLAEESLRKYEIHSTNKYVLTLVKVDKVMTQVVSGSLTRIDFKASTKHCLLGKECPELNKQEILQCHSEIWDQPWLKDGKRINVNCVSNRKYIVPGAPEEQEPNKNEYRQLAVESLRQYEIDFNSSYVFTLVEMDKVTTQVVEGLLTRIDFKASPALCALKGDCSKVNMHAVYKCHSEIWSRPWMVDGKQIVVNCYDGPITGGLKEEDPNDSTFRDLAEESLRKYEIHSTNKYALTLVKVDKVMTQVVSGSLTRIDFKALTKHCLLGKECPELNKQEILQCHSEIWDQPWLKDGKRINVNCVSNRKYIVPGAPEEQEPNKNEYRQLAVESLRQYEIDFNSSYVFTLVEMDKVTTQVVEGLLTRIDFKASPALCALKGDCSKVNMHAVYKCHSEIWSRPWMVDGKQIVVNCYDGPITGGLKEEDPNDSIFRDLAEESLRKYEIHSTNKYALTLVKVDKVMTQVVSGSLTRIDFKALTKHCLLGKECPELNKQEILQCHSEIWDQPWLKDGKRINVNCVSNRKYIVPGAPEEQDPNKNEYRQLAVESLRQYEIDFNSSYVFTLVEMDKVTTQVVEGLLTRIDFKASPALCALKGDCSKVNMHAVYKCHSEIWSRPWMVDGKQIVVNCYDGPIVGGWKEENPNDSRFRDLAEESLRKYEIHSTNKYALTLVKVDKVMTQVVSGSLTRIDFKASTKHCLLGKECPELNKQEILQCHSEIWDQPWLKDGKRINVNCVSNRKYIVPGAPEEQDPNKNEYRQLAVESLRQYEIDFNSSYVFTLVEMDKVTTQVVEGLLTRIDFKASPALCALKGDCSKVNMHAVYKCHSEIWSRPWMVDGKQIVVNCYDGPIVGGWKEENPNDSRFRDLAEESLRKYEIHSTNKYALTLVKVDKVMTQVVSGSLTRIDFKASTKHCLLGKECPELNKQEILQCHSEIWDQPWLKDGKRINVNCVSNRKYIVPGAPEEQDPNKNEYRQLAVESLRQYEIDFNSSYVFTLVEMDKVTTQVVEGLLTRIDFKASPALCALKGDCSKVNMHAVYKCHSEIWSRPWMVDGKQIVVNCYDGPIVGGWKEENPNDSRFRDLAEESLRKYEIHSTNKYALTLVKVDKVMTQVVSGSLTRIDFKASTKHCLLGKECPELNKQEILQCHSEIWDQPWLKDGKRINVNCVSNRKYIVPGAPEEQDPNKNEYRQLAVESLRQYEIDFNSSYVFTLVEMDKVTTQVVEGLLTRIDFKASPALCALKGDCSKVNMHAVYKCHSEIWSRPWMVDGKQIVVNCNDGPIVGGWKEENPNDSRFRDLAEESLRKYEMHSTNKYVLTLVKVDKVMTQVVSGSLTRIDFKASTTHCLLGKECPELNKQEILQCHSEIWDQPWLENGKKIIVNCIESSFLKRAKRQIIGN